MDGSEDVNDFLQRIKELGDRRDQEDEERNRKLEEEILKGKLERQARRAERARSISPTKSSPASTPRASRTPVQSISLPPPEPSGSEHRKSPGSDSINKEEKDLDMSRSVSTKPSPSTAMPSRNSPLSWQRRPSSQSADHPRNRPLSLVAAENAARSPKTTQTSEASPTVTEPTLSREQIAQSLASKDPAWFRQTADRGKSSPAYRRNQVEEEERSHHGSSVPVQLPGMSRNTSDIESSDQTSNLSQHDGASGEGSAPPSSTAPARHRSSSSVVPSMSSQKLDPPQESRGLAMSPTQGRLSPERMDRPVSPTKGMGGFVQSAMMKRSDSVSKRWSVQATPGLKRGNSIAGNRGSRDVSSVGTSPVRDVQQNEQSVDHSQGPSSDQSDSKSAMGDQADVPTSSQDNQEKLQAATPDQLETTPPASPSKTMDQRRWSPTKSSWLENALNKPESPKLKPSVVSQQQPAWMSELNRTKKASVDLGRPSTGTRKHEVNVGGLLKSPFPSGVASPPNASGNSTGASSAGQQKGIVGGSSDQGTGSPKLTETPVSNDTKDEALPKKDFKPPLKPRQPLPGDSGSEELEFKNVFGQLRRTKTQNYVAPDLLKDNITRGKAGLNITGGPKKTEHVDEFKDAILKKKEDFKKAQIEGKGITRTPTVGSDTSIPEAIAKRRALGRSNTIVKELEQSVSSELTESPKSASPVPLQKEISAPGRLQAGKLAERFNPALAGLLARGPPSVHPTSTQRSSNITTSGGGGDTPQAGPQLTHMTKGRARGPKRKTPTQTFVAKPTTEATDRPLKISTGSETKPLTIRQSQSQESSRSSPMGSSMEESIPEPTSPRKLDIKRRSQFLQEASGSSKQAEPHTINPKPSQGSKNPAPELAKKIAAITTEVPPHTPKSKPEPPSKSPELVSKTFTIAGSEILSTEKAKSISAPLSTVKTNVVGKTDVEPAVSVKNVAAMWNRPANEQISVTPPRAKSPVKLPTQRDEDTAMQEAGLHPKPPPKEPGSAFSARTATPNLAEKQKQSKYTADTLTILSSNTNLPPIIKTLRSSLYQLSDDGKKIPVPNHQERILFEGNMYLGFHTFGDAMGKKISEAYFWVGDDVPPRVASSAERVAEREAKSFGGTLVKIIQGKETAEFVQSLGGIIIIRRGTSNKYDSLAPHILCGRQYVGQIAFDEVDYSPASLCSGFPYLISTPTGKCYLWKGKGSGIDELSCARLIGMDFGLTGEIEEIEDGNEPASFLETFGPNTQIPKSADHWRMKANYTKYRGRLFCADSTVYEINPFCQADLSPSNVYILDAFFEIYIIVGSRAQSEYESFNHALLFAQEYGILASGAEDRPFVPVTNVILEGVPKDMKSVFRKWTDELAPTIQQATKGLRRGRSLRVVPLTAALEATRN
ncbi:hypothetical protein F5884DRAFT_667166 [Xylogone sp. PMI_703]|nr:hypothetical protein F5884DRAFT_667166 [Xylogone sp. PMI_703]